MRLDDPEKPEFASWDSYRHFARSVRHQRRYVFTPDVTAFLQTVLATNRRRDVDIPEGSILFRAQRGVDWQTIEDDDGNTIGEEPLGYGALRMKPRPNKSTEGRANPTGIPVLYLGTTEETVISEVRPWIGAELSVARFRINRTLKAIDLSKGHGKTSLTAVKLSYLVGDEDPPAAVKAKAVWIEIDNAFSRPVTVSDDAADYVPTQILAELFRDQGYDAIIYKSQFGKKGYNIAAFDLNAADPISCAPYEVQKIAVKYRQIGNDWFRQKPKDTAKDTKA